MFCWIAVVLALVSLFISRHGNVRVFMLVIVGILFALAYYQMLSARRPRCKTHLLLALGTFGVRLGIPLWFTSCPSCWLSFDAKRDVTQTV
jgi:hypothetical protein